MTSTPLAPTGSRRRRAGFTLTEIMIASAIALMAVSATLGAYIFSLRMMYRNGQRLATNATLRSFLGHITTNAMDSTEFLLFPNRSSLDGNVNLGVIWPDSSLSQPLADTFGSDLAQGNCLVLIKRLTLDPSAKIQRVRVYYRNTTDNAMAAPILFFERDFGASGTTETIEDVLNDLTLPTTASGGAHQLVERAIGRRNAEGTLVLPVFSAETPSGTTPSYSSVALNLEVINGTTANNMLSSSSFNYVISPRR